MYVSFTYYDDSETPFDVGATLTIDKPDARSYSIDFEKIIGPNGEEMSAEDFSDHEERLCERAVEEGKDQIRRHSPRGSRFRY